MEPFNQFGFTYSKHLPIRRFSKAARFEEQNQLLEDDHHSCWALQHLLDDVDDDDDDDRVYRMEEYQFVDSCFNLDHISSPDENQLQSYESFLIPDDNEDVDQMIIEGEYDHVIDMESSCEDATYVSSLLSSSLSEMSMQPEFDNSTTSLTTPMVSNGVDDGLQLVHLLLACAEAVGCRDTQLADSILSQIWYSATPFGDSLQRVAYCFAVGLKSRLSLLHNGTVHGCAGVTPLTDVTKEDRIEAFHLLHRTTPYITFGFTAANEAIVQAAGGNDRLHIVDLGMEHALQWPTLIRTLASTMPKLIRITGILGDRGDKLELESSMNETVVAEAKSLGINVEFRLIPGPATSSMLTREYLRLEEGEPLFVNSILHLHTYVKESRGSLKTILQSIKKLGPTLLTVVEQDANHNGPFFLGRFLESLHYYSAVFDSLEASMERNSIERMKIERNHFAEEIKNIVAYEGLDRVERHERADQWRRQLGRAGFQVAAGTKERQAAVMKSVSSVDGYTVGNDEKGCVLLGWKGRPIMLASAWQPSTPVGSS